MSPTARAYAYHYTSLYQLHLTHINRVEHSFLRHQNLNDLLPHISQNLQDIQSQNNNNNHWYKYSISTQPYYTLHRMYSAFKYMS